MCMSTCDLNPLSVCVSLRWAGWAALLSYLRRPCHRTALWHYFLRGLQGLLQAQHLQQACLPLQPRQELRDVTQTAQPLPVLQATQVPADGNEPQRWANTVISVALLKHATWNGFACWCAFASWFKLDYQMVGNKVDLVGLRWLSKIQLKLVWPVFFSSTIEISMTRWSAFTSQTSSDQSEPAWKFELV